MPATAFAETPPPAPAAAQEAQAPLVGVILVNCNAWRDTVATHRALLQSACKLWTLIVVDNASTDDSVLRLTEALPQAVLIRSPVDSGLAGGRNLGLRQAQALGLRHAFLLHNGAEVLPDTIGALLDASAALHDNAVLGSVLRYWPSGALQFFGSRTHPLHGGPDWYREPAQANVLQQPLIECDFVLGAALFMPMQIVRDVGGLDERFFVTYEETDWCYRARARGWRACVVAASVVRCAGSASAAGHEAPMRTYFLHRNRLLFSEKHAAPDQRLRVLHHTWRAFRSDLGKSQLAARARGLRMDPGKKALLLAVRDYLLRRFGDCPPALRQHPQHALPRSPNAQHVPHVQDRRLEPAPAQAQRPSPR